MAAVLLFGWFLAYALRPHIFIDDAAITFRYAERIADGQGFTYNDHERVQGASSPLYALLLAAGHLLGFPVPSVAWRVAVGGFLAGLWLTYSLTKSLASGWAGFLAALALASDRFFRDQCLGGMESVVSVVLGLLAISLLARQREVAGGVALGLAVWNKLDAGLLSVAIAGAWLASRRRFPWRVALSAATVATPWFVFAAAYFGSVLPNSFVVKLATGRALPFNHGWVAGMFHDAYRWVYFVPAGLTLIAVRRLDENLRFVAVALAGWLTLHALVFSVMGLGDYYPWYLTVLYPPLLILAAAGPRLSEALVPKSGMRRALAGTTMTVVFLLPAGYGFRNGTWGVLRSGNPITAYEAFDNDRRMAGIFLDEYAGPKEVVTSAFGWVAFESKRPFNDVTGLNSRELLPDAQYLVFHGVPWNRGGVSPVAPPGYMPLAVFDLAHRMDRGYSWFTLFGTPESQIARSGLRMLNLPLTTFPFPDDSAHSEARVVGDTLTMPASGVIRYRFVSLTVGAGELRFVPWAGPASQDLPVTFQVRGNGELLWLGTVRGADTPRVERVSIPPWRGDLVLDLAATTASTLSQRAFDVEWRGLELRVQTATVDQRRIGNRALREAWCAANPCPTGVPR